MQADRSYVLNHVVRNRSLGFPTRSNTNRAARPHNMARGLKFRFHEEEGLDYPCSENKCADQLRGCFMQYAGFLMTWLS